MKSRHRVWLLALCLSNFFALTEIQAQQLEWVRQLGTTNHDYSRCVFASPLGSVYIAGGTDGSLGRLNAGFTDVFVGEYSPLGTMLGTRQLGTIGDESASSIYADSLGYVYIAGATNGSLGGGNSGLDDAFVFRYDPSPYNEWTRQFGTANRDWSTGVAADSFGNVYMSGHSIGLRAGQLDGPYYAFVRKYNSSGGLQWARELGTVGNVVSSGISLDASGNAFISGYTDGNLGGRNAGEYDAFLAKYDASGNLQWTRQLGTVRSDHSNCVSTDALGNVYISGYTQGSLGAQNAGTSYLSDPFVSKYDTAGNLQWTRQLGTEYDDESTSVSADLQGNVYISGYTDGNLGGPNAGSADAFVSKYDASGNFLWSRQLGTMANDKSYGVAADSRGNVYISGATNGNLGGPNAGPFGSYDAFLVKFSTIPEPGTLLLATLASVALLLPRARRQTERTLISANPR